MLLREFHLPPGSMGLLLSAFFWTYAAFQLPAGLLIDRIGVRRSYLWAFLLWSLASAAMAVSRNVETMFALRLLLGLAESVGPLASLAYIRSAFPEAERGLPVSIYIAGQTIGPACGALLGTKLIVALGWRFLFAATGLGALLWVPAWLYFARLETPPPAAKANAKPLCQINWRKLLASPALWAISAAVFLFSYYWYFLLTWIPTYLNMSRGFPLIAMGRIISVPLFIMAPVNIALGWFADRIVSRGHNPLTLRVYFAVAGFAGAGSILLLGRVSGSGPILAVMIVTICSFGVGSANFWALAQHAAPNELTARVLGYFNTLSQIAGAVAPIITGYSLGPSRNFSLSIMLAGLSTLAASCLLFAAGPRGILSLRRRFEP